MTTSRLELLHAEALRLDESDPAPKRDAFELPRNDKGTLAHASHSLEDVNAGQVSGWLRVW